MKIFELLKKELLYAGLTREDLAQVKGQIGERNRITVIKWSVIAGLFWIYSLLMSLRAEDYLHCRYVYLVALCICIITLFGGIFLAKKVFWTILPVMYLFQASLLGAGIGIAICQPDVRTVSMIAFAIIVPCCFIDRFITSIVIHTIVVIVYIFTAKGVIMSDIYYWGLQNLIIFSIAGLMVGQVINRDRFARYLYADSAQKLAEIQSRYARYDQMTELKNRRFYAEKIEELNNDMPDGLRIIIADVNGLKDLNDTQGHDAGDELLKGAAECLKEAFDYNDDIYRIGGDEFCIITLVSAEEVNRSLEKLEKISSAWKGDFVDGISISYGVGVKRENSDVASIIEEADNRMYDHKRNYYTTSGLDRRRR